MFKLNLERVIKDNALRYKDYYLNNSLLIRRDNFSKVVDLIKSNDIFIINKDSIKICIGFWILTMENRGSFVMDNNVSIELRRDYNFFLQFNFQENTIRGEVFLNRKNGCLEIYQGCRIKKLEKIDLQFFGYIAKMHKDNKELEIYYKILCKEFMK